MLIILVAFLSVLSLATTLDPTTVCYPTQFQVEFHNIINNDHGVLAVDFKKELYGLVSEKTGFRTVHDFEKLKAYTVESNTSCQHYHLPVSRIMQECLPPYAKLFPSTSGTFGFHNPIATQTWEVETEFGKNYRITFENAPCAGGHYWPLWMQELDFSGTSSFYIYMNVRPNITYPEIFDLPEICSRNETEAPVIG